MIARDRAFNVGLLIRQPAFEARLLLERVRQRSRTLKFAAHVTGQPPVPLGDLLNQLRWSRLETRILRLMGGEGIRPVDAGAVGKDAAHALYLIARSLRATRVVETGVSGGVSSAYLLQAIADNGVPQARVHSIDLAPEDAHARFAFSRYAPGSVELALAWERCGSGWAIPKDLKAYWALHQGDTFQVLPSLLAAVGPIDFFVHDSDHRYECQRFEYMTAWPALRSGGVLLSHDVDASGAFVEFARSVGRPPSYLGKKTAALVKP